MEQNLIAQLGVAAAIVAFAVWVILDMRTQLAKKDALIASKDATILEMLPVLSNANQRMGEIATATTELVREAGAARERDRERRGD